MTRKELAELIKSVDEAEARLENIRSDKQKLCKLIEANSTTNYWLNTTRFDSTFKPEELLMMYNHIENKLIDFLDVGKTTLDTILGVL